MASRRQYSNIDLAGLKVLNLANPTAEQDAATKIYTDGGDAVAKNRANHTGTQPASTISDFDIEVRENRLDQMSVPISPLFMNAQRITSIGAPSAFADAATKGYVDTASTNDRNRANHSGTQTASTISDFITQVRSNRLDQMAAPTTAVSMNSQKITDLGNPTTGTDAATKAYVDAAAAGFTPTLYEYSLSGSSPYNGGSLLFSRIGDLVIVSGGLQRASGFSSSMTSVGSIPLGWRPSSAQVTPATLIFAGASTLYQYTFLTDGTVQARQNQANANSLSISGFAYFTTDPTPA